MTISSVGPVPVTGAFRVNAKNFFLTYPQCPLMKGDVYVALVNKFGPIQYACIASEKHEDGSPHIHVFLTFDVRKDVRNPRTFDIEDYHPNVQAIRNKRAALNYVMKDGDYVEYGTLDDSHQDLTAVCKEMEWTTWLEYCIRKRIPFGYCQAFWQTTRSSIPTITDQSTVGTMCDKLLKQIPFFLENTRSLLVLGPTGCGKTTFAKVIAPLPILLCSHVDDLKYLTKEHKSIIFDDMDFRHIPRTAQIHLVDRYETRSIQCRYRCAIVPAGIVKIFTANERPLMEDSAIERRLNTINLF